jgi:hypothetical protein
MDPVSREIACEAADQIQLAQDRIQWWYFVNMVVMNI